MLAKIRRKKEETIERVQVTDAFTQVLQRNASHTEQGRMLNFLRREFPMSFERFLMENGGRIPAIPLYFPLCPSGRGVGDDFSETKEEAGPADMLIETEAALTTMMCGMPTYVSSSSSSPAVRRDVPSPDKVTRAVATDIWTLLAGVFCFSVSKSYMPNDDEYVTYTGSMSDVEAPGADSPPVAKKKPKSLISKLNPMKLLGPIAPSAPKPANPLVFHPSTDYRLHRERLAPDLSDDAQRILKLYTGITRETGLTFDWALKTSRNNIFVHTADVPGSNFSALKSDCTIKKDKYTILRCLTDDDKSKDYDETLEGYKLMEIVDDRTRIRRYFYKGIWPCSPRDFVLLTTWRELEDGSWLVSTISPPDELYPKNAGYVRATILISGAHIRPIAANLGGGCAITVIGHSDIKGSVPSLVINQLSSTIPYKFMKKLKEAIEASR